ncbi:C40 family peptidase [Paenibacillus hexagrammi]|uniref:C40 family peptidase n=1 Tax=Paenibacillus hexagrammi TaxID=2908839 RepID=A0ABY3SNI4_9BACL|nr:C40 family peptidase [Paenibacillus sp. YPD9-1]UJF34690.1 C40 family peptidase [Paenibacillus sp. YPD9-1]
MWNKLRSTAIGSMIVILATTTACGSNQASPKSNNPNNPNGASVTQTPSAQMNADTSLGPRSLAQNNQGMTMLGASDASVPIKAIGNANYVSAIDLAKTVRFQTDWDEANADRFLIGDNDANYEITMNSTKAMKDGSEIHVSQPFVKEGGTPYIPIAALGDLFQEDMSYEVKDGNLLVHPSSEPTIEHEDDPSPKAAGAELDFGEDPNDPFKGGDVGVNPASVEDGTGQPVDLEVWAAEGDTQDVPVLKNIDINGLIRKGRQYLGVKYKFGAKPYSVSGRFDCSTFTQYVFGKYGVKLPRLARQQSNHGTLVSRKNLRKGDLMFYYVPGRFKSNKTVGHVGIYIGNMQMLHASPEPKNGVQISSINKAYWKETFLRARRVAY